MTAEPTHLHEVFGLACGLSLRPSMARAHRHDDIDSILPLDGSAVLEHAGGRHDLTDRSCAVFWAGRPHRVVDHDDGMTVAWLAVPLVDVLAWSLPASFTGDMLRGGLSTFDRPAGARVGDGVLAGRHRCSPALTHAVRLEAHAWLLRASSVGHASAPTGSHDTATAMASYVSTSFREPLAVADVASVVHLHPSTAAAVFVATWASRSASCLAGAAFAEAQRLLISTRATTSDIALRFRVRVHDRLYERFGRDVGMSQGHVPQTDALIVTPRCAPRTESRGSAPRAMKPAAAKATSMAAATATALPGRPAIVHPPNPPPVIRAPSAPAEGCVHRDVSSGRSPGSRRAGTRGSRQLGADLPRPPPSQAIAGRGTRPISAMT